MNDPYAKTQHFFADFLDDISRPGSIYLSSFDLLEFEFKICKTQLQFSNEAKMPFI
jgi:hypothetical protein